MANLEATEINPLYRRYQYQLMLTLRALLKNPPGQVTITEDAIERIHFKSMGISPWQPGLLAARFEYLMLTNQKVKAKKIMERLKETARLQKATKEVENIWRSQCDNYC